MLITDHEAIAVAIALRGLYPCYCGRYVRIGRSGLQHSGADPKGMARPYAYDRCQCGRHHVVVLAGTSREDARSVARHCRWALAGKEAERERSRIHEEPYPHRSQLDAAQRDIEVEAWQRLAAAANSPC